MKRRNYFYLTTNFSPERWEKDLQSSDEYHKFIGSKYWPYTLAEAKAMAKTYGYDSIYKFGLPFYNYIETKR